MTNVPEIFGSLVFGDSVMKRSLPKETYRAFRSLVDAGKPLTLEVANVVAHEMKEWAISKGATHYTHWFQPMTGITAEKHDSFINPIGDGTVIMSFSGKELIKGEPDASSFPNGGLRSTFEARGYTAWDPTCDAFIKDGTLCIPTAFCSYSGQVLDKKTPLLRSTKALSDQAVRLLKVFGKTTDKVVTTVGPEQEYFLIDKALYLKRKDLIFSGRTLFGAKPPKGQELEDHYFGSIRPRVLAFMADLDEQLWKMGILAKTRHNEVAPAQHELAPIYTLVNVAADHNQLTMEFMRKIADKHGLMCLLHEKPFAGVNGSGKHNNWSISTAEGENLLEPGKNPQENLLFLTILSAVIAAVDDHQDLLRLSVASAGNDHRLGANEAPPAIISMYLGDELTAILESIETGKHYEHIKATAMKLGVDVIPEFMRDTTDRNRTSPFAFTGNKFEFRMLGSTSNISCPNTMINAAVAEKFDEFATRLEKSADLNADVYALIKESYAKHKRIVFNGNGYSEEWTAEAERRGLLNLKNTPDALVRYTDEKNLKLLAKYGIYTPVEVAARQEILLDNYSKIINIEAQTMIEMANKEIIPACAKFTADLAEGIAKKAALGISALAETDVAKKVSELTDRAYAATKVLEDVVVEAKLIENVAEAAHNYHDKVVVAMQELRAACDAAETIVSKEYWPFPTYSDLLFSV
ncbi:MAG TPA: glutamine synthetase type III [Clostridiales bacterium]|nr:glutamine synthetase type III [Clostridiales bacterium]